jgi:hypothetical protein
MPAELKLKARSLQRQLIQDQVDQREAAKINWRMDRVKKTRNQIISLNDSIAYKIQNKTKIRYNIV